MTTFFGEYLHQNEHLPTRGSNSSKIVLISDHSSSTTALFDTAACRPVFPHAFLTLDVPRMISCQALRAIIIPHSKGSRGLSSRAFLPGLLSYHVLIGGSRRDAGQGEGACRLHITRPFPPSGCGRACPGAGPMRRSSPPRAGPWCGRTRPGTRAVRGAGRR